MFFPSVVSDRLHTVLWTGGGATQQGRVGPTFFSFFFFFLFFFFFFSFCILFLVDLQSDGLGAGGTP